MESKSITYVSGNVGKISEIKRLNNGYVNLNYLDLDLELEKLFIQDLISQMHLDGIQFLNLIWD